MLRPDDAEEAALRSQRGVDRLAAFSDAVVAIAITLVVLPLVDLAGGRDATAAGVFTADRYRLGAAAVSFVVIGSLWRDHHSGFARAVRDSRILVSVDLLWLAAIAFLPVPTALLFSDGRDADEQVVVAVYAGTMAVAQLAMRLMVLEIRLHCSDGDLPPLSPLRFTAQWASPVLMLVAGGLSLAGLGSRALLVLLLALPIAWVSTVVRRHRHPPAAS